MDTRETIVALAAFVCLSFVTVQLRECAETHEQGDIQRNQREHVRHLACIEKGVYCGPKLHTY